MLNCCLINFNIVDLVLVGEVNFIKKFLVKYNNMYFNESKYLGKSMFILKMVDFLLNIDGFVWFVDLKLGIIYVLMRIKRVILYFVEKC